MLRFVFKSIIILLIIFVLFCATLPILTGEINEKQYAKESYLRVIDVLPENDIAVWSGSLPEIEDKIKIKKIAIDLSEQRMYLYENNGVVDEFSVSTGQPGLETPIGEFKIYEKRERAWSRMAGLWMPYWMMIIPSKGIGIHELPEWPNGVKEGEDHLGQPVSHGCIRLGVGAAEKVYQWVELGVQVEIIE